MASGGMASPAAVSDVRQDRGILLALVADLGHFGRVVRLCGLGFR